MSVNITVNGKFAKHCRTHPLLDDPQQVRKQEEQERRKLRLLQVMYIKYILEKLKSVLLTITIDRYARNPRSWLKK